MLTVLTVDRAERVDRAGRADPVLRVDPSEKQNFGLRIDTKSFRVYRFPDT